MVTKCRTQPASAGFGGSNTLAWILVAFLLLLSPGSLMAQASPEHRSWNRPVEPFRIVGDLYYVGASDIAAYLIPTSEGHILIDTGLPETLPQILSNTGRLGFRAADIRIVLNTQAHFDHIGGHAQLKRLTGARVVLSEQDALLAARGGTDDFAFGDTLPYAPVRADRIIRDGERVSLGDVTLTAHLTPGHTKGCTTWTMTARESERSYEVAILCSVSFPGYQLVDNAAYPAIEDDFRRSFARLESMTPDVFLASHASFFDLAGKRQRLTGGSSHNPFVDPGEWHRHLAAMKSSFERRLGEQRAARTVSAPAADLP